MEGLVETAGDPSLNNYGGGDDDYDAGNLSYLSIRYAGRVVGLSNELNGLSLVLLVGIRKSTTLK